MRIGNLLRLAIAGTGIAMLSMAVSKAADRDNFSIASELRTLNAPLDAAAPQLRSLTAKAGRSGTIRIIARVARPSGMPLGPGTDASLAAANTDFRQRLSDLGVAESAPIGDLPLSVLEVTADQLQKMVDAGLVSDVVEDIPVPPTLQDSIPLIHATQALTLGASGAGQTIAILDTGVEANHPFFGGRVVAQACFSSNVPAQGATSVCPGGATTSTAAGSAAPCGVSGCDHGTHVAGIAAGQDANRRGVAPQANLIAIQVFSRFDDTPGGPQSCANVSRPSPCILSFTSDQIRALQQVFDWRNNFTIASVNMSLGGGNNATCDTDTRKASIDQLRAAGIATVIASGNGGSSTGVGAPGCISTAITVGNTTKSDVVSATSDSAAVVDLLAPGTNITSSVLSGGFGSKSGTSMATPHVAGAFAALRSVRNDLTVDQIEQALESTGVSITDSRNNLARPRIDLEAAVRAVTTPVWSGAIWRYTNVPCTGESCPGWQRLDNNPRTVSIVAGDALYQMHSNGWIWQHTGTPCNGDSCPGWVRLDNNPMGIAIVASAGKLYQLQRDGGIWEYTGTPCNGDVCPGWRRLDNNPMGIAIVADAGQLYQLHRDGAIWRYTGTACNGNSCPGWARLDNNPMATAIAAGGGKLYQLHRDGRIWRYTGTPCNGNSCPGWSLLDNNPMALAIVAGGDQLYQLHRDGRIWRWTGVACQGESCLGWQLLDNNPMANMIAASAGKLYQLHRNGAVWEYTGVPCTGDSCPGWRRLDNNPLTRAIVTAGGALYQLHGTAVTQRHVDGRLWQATGSPCAGQNCPGWQMLDNNPATTQLRFDRGYAYQLHNNGRIWRATFGPCQGESCPGWEMLDNNTRTQAIATANGQVYQLHVDGRIWRSTGAACQGQSCPGWQMLDNNPRTIAIAAGGGQLYQLHRDGRIWRSTGLACQGNVCPGWQMLDNNPNTVAITAAGDQLYQLHRDGRIWRSTGGVCQGESCPGWQMLDNNPNTIAIVAGGNQLFQLHRDGRIWRSTGGVCQGQSCPGWQMLDNNPSTVGISAGDNQLFQLHRDGRIWRSTGGVCQGQSCPGWQMLDNNGRTRQISAGAAN
ncbi:hypothetical protein GCM10007874_26310 [Labrys miyagiensis]|uniref:Peptidase S8/S53 domain-containing protein n=2 Tax=Labrys miyagiensis TaxID=346912 RepID=A0ABQ6CH98_9HYPH|nr:hypothetical protein GCM10007874_26310 [Labrys miyagiensis]